MKVTFGGRIRELRLAARLSQRELAVRVAKRLKDDDKRGFDFTYLSKIENNRLEHLPSVSAILALASVLNANGDELLALAGKVSPDVGDMMKKSAGARVFFRSAIAEGLSEEDWTKLLADIRSKKKQ